MNKNGFIFYILFVVCGISVIVIRKIHFMKYAFSISRKNSDILTTTYPYQLPALGYAYDALEPYIDAETMRIHHTKHHQAYIDKLNEILKNHPELQNQSLGELLLSSQDFLGSTSGIHDNGGGHFNHSFFWTILQAPSEKKPAGVVIEAIEKKFGSFENFKHQFTEVAKSRFGSGWAWLSLDRTGNLVIHSTANQDTPLAQGLTPLLALDLWEHAYYLHYQNKRADYIQAWWNIINWEQVNAYYLKFKEVLAL